MFWLDGLTAVACGAAAGLICSFVLDYFLTLPRGVRGVGLLGGIIALVYFVRRRITQPLAKPISDEDLANLVESSHPELHQSLITAVELTRSNSETARYVSASMLETVVKGVEEHVTNLRFGRIFDLTRLRRKLGLLVAVVVVLLAGAVSRSELASIWFARNLLLSAQAWPKLTELRLVTPAGPFPAVVAMGDDLEVSVEVLRGSPPVVEMTLWDGHRLLRSDTLAEATSGLFRKLVENVARPFSFKIKGGDDELGVFDVQVRLRPRIDARSMQLWCEYPAYTGLAPTPQGESIRHGNLKVPEGTTVRYRMATNVPIAKAYYVFLRKGAPKVSSEGRSSGSSTGALEEGASEEAVSQEAGLEEIAGSEELAWPHADAVELPLEGESVFSGDFTVSDNGQYYFQFEAVDGFRNLKPDRFRIEAIRDQKPRVKILEPRRLTERVSPDATVIVRVTASDDYGLNKGVLEGLYFPPAREAFRNEEETSGVSQSRPFPRLGTGSQPVPRPADDGGRVIRDGGQTIEDSLTLDIVNLETGGTGPPRVGGRFQFYALAMDFADRVGESEIHSLEVVDKEELLRILTDRLMIVRDQLRDALRRQKSARKDLEAFQASVALKEKLSATEGSKLFRHRQAQGRVTQALERQTGALDNILSSTARNKLGEEKWKQWVTGIRDDVLALAQRKSPSVEEAVEELQKGTASEPRDVTSLSVVTSQQRDIEREIDAIVMRLTEFGDKNAVIQMLRQVRRRQVDLREETRTRATNSAPEEPQK